VSAPRICGMHMPDACAEGLCTNEENELTHADASIRESGPDVSNAHEASRGDAMTAPELTDAEAERVARFEAAEYPAEVAEAAATLAPQADDGTQGIWLR
jgi:hypothetical protein